jgi:hypothetical protein
MLLNTATPNRFSGSIPTAVVMPGVLPPCCHINAP